MAIKKNKIDIIEASILIDAWDDYWYYDWDDFGEWYDNNYDYSEYYLLDYSYVYGTTMIDLDSISVERMRNSIIDRLLGDDLTTRIGDFFHAKR